MKIQLLLYILFFTISTVVKGQSIEKADSSVTIKPLVAIKFAPISLLNPDTNLEFQIEYFTKNKSSVELSYGFGDNTIFKGSDRLYTRLYRLEFKRYLRPFTTKKRSSPFFGTELTYKNALINKIGYKKTADNTFDPENSIDYQLDVNFAAARLKYGFTHFNKVGLPVFSSFIGVGIGYFNNLEIGLPMGYLRGDTDGQNIFDRFEGTRTTLSLTAGISIGVGFFRKH